ncbi:MAG: polysaccharide biosynthesis C-terminal domain-containing protein [Defluviitaleaceae bacterium]|nr:polysaccharide biosynthesis C-terminal domain-containing protein [Defluviitaleaceae bacterium]
MKKTGNTVFWVAIIMLLTKVIVMFGNILYMARFGINPQVNIYAFALQMPNIIFNIIGTALNTVLIPIYLSFKSKNDEAGAKKFIDNIITIASIGIFVLIGGGVFLAPLIARVGGYSISDEAGYFSYAVFAIRILLPIMFFHGLNYIFQGFLQANGKFKLPAFVAAPSSVVVIFYVVFLGNRFGITGLLFATLIGFSLQPLIMVPMVRKLGYRYKFSFGIKDTAIIQAGKFTLPVLLSVSSYQINMFFNTTMAFRFGTNAIMTLVQQVVLVSILTICYAVINVYFPRLTRLWEDKSIGEYKASLRDIISMLSFILIPAALGFFVLRRELSDFLANWGRIEATYVIIAGNMLAIYGFSVLAVGLKEVMDKAFYAQKNTKTPAIFGFVIMAANILISLILLNRLGTYSMPVAYAISSYIGLSGLIIVMNKQIKFITKSLCVNVLKCFISAAVMAGFVFLVLRWTSYINFGPEVVARVIRIAIPAIFGVLIYFVTAIVLRMPQAVEFTKKIRRA